jgi:chromosome segregation ATPase
MAEDLTREVESLISMVRELEDHLVRLTHMKGALESDLSAERDRAAQVEHLLEQLRGRLRRLSSVAADEEALSQEIGTLARDRAELTATTRHLLQRLHDLRDARKARERAIEQLNAERAERASELSSVESQLGRALTMSAQAEARLSITTEERDALRAASAAAQQKLASTQRERDELLAEVGQSRSALDRLRRSISGRV